MEEEKVILDISSEKMRFKEHLNLPDNNQIIFSGIFGIGKTYFLKEFFDDEKETYEEIKISPVNYSISKNDDIIEYIKYDIIFQLLSKGIDFEKTDLTTLLTSQVYLKENFTEVMSILAVNAVKINKPFNAIFNSLKEIKEKIEKHNGSVNVDQQKELIDFLSSIKEKTGSIYEENNLTVLISSLINGLKEEGRKIVLTIDDTDRLDPEHIFRILNVFACHFEFNDTQENKFSLDKVILVCDIENIRKMFHSKYGQDVDFSGYIEKFYSQEIFCYDNKKIIKDSLSKILKSIKQQKNDLDFFPLQGNGVITALLNEVIDHMISINVINLRTLMSLNNKEYKVLNYNFRKGGSSAMPNKSYDILLIFDFLTSLFGSKKGVEIALEKLNKQINDVLTDDIGYYFDNYISLINFLSPVTHNTRSEEKEYSYPIKELGLIFKYELEAKFFGVKLGNLKVFDLDENAINRFPLFKVLLFAFKKYDNINKL